MSQPEQRDPVDRGNLRLVGQILAVSGLVLTGFAAIALIGWLPVSAPANKAAAIVFALTAAVELIAAFFFVQRYKE